MEGLSNFTSWPMALWQAGPGPRTIPVVATHERCACARGEFYGIEMTVDPASSTAYYLLGLTIDTLFSSRGTS
jgi:hypothetical protein